MKKITIHYKYTSNSSKFVRLDNERVNCSLLHPFYQTFSRFRRNINTLTIKELKYETDIYNTSL